VLAYYDLAEVCALTLKCTHDTADIFRRFVAECLHKNKEVRASPSALLKHPFIQRYESFLLPAGSWMCAKHKPTVGISVKVQSFRQTR